MTSSTVISLSVDRPLGQPRRGGVRLGAYVTLPRLQQEAVHGAEQLVVGKVVEDQYNGSWDDEITVRLLLLSVWMTVRTLV